MAIEGTQNLRGIFPSHALHWRPSAQSALYSCFSVCSLERGSPRGWGGALGSPWGRRTVVESLVESPETSPFGMSPDAASCRKHHGCCASGIRTGVHACRTRQCGPRHL
jgi:hypothetical protein